jgi:hypothetical protein
MASCDVASVMHGGPTREVEQELSTRTCSSCGSDTYEVRQRSFTPG